MVYSSKTTLFNQAVIESTSMADPLGRDFLFCKFCGTMLRMESNHVVCSSCKFKKNVQGIAIEPLSTPNEPACYCEFCCVKTIGSCVMCIMRSPWILHAADLMLGVMMIDEWDHFLLFIAEWWLTFLCWLPLCADVADREISYAVTAEVCLQLNYWYLLSLDWFCLFKMVS